MNTKLPPGPTNFNASFGLTWRHYFQLRNNPIQFATKLSQRYGDLAFFRLFWHRAYLVNQPDLIRQVLVSEAKNFPKFDRIREHLRQATGEGLLVAEGDSWRSQRAVAQKVFRSSRMDLFAKLTSDLSSAMLDTWEKREQIQIEHEMTSLLQAIMGLGFFGVEADPGNQIAEAVREYSDIFHRESRALFSLPDRFPLPFKQRKRKSIKLLRSTLNRIVADRIQLGERRDDLLDLLLHAGGAEAASSRSSLPDGVAPDAITSQLLTLYIAGFHTTSVALAWLFFAVARHQQVQQKLRNEIRQVCQSNRPSLEHLDQLPYTQMVVKESLRLYPAAWELFARRSVHDTELGGYPIPAALFPNTIEKVVIR